MLKALAEKKASTTTLPDEPTTTSSPEQSNTRPKFATRTPPRLDKFRALTESTVTSNDKEELSTTNFIPKNRATNPVVSTREDNTQGFQPRPSTFLRPVDSPKPSEASASDHTVPRVKPAFISPPPSTNSRSDPNPLPESRTDNTATRTRSRLPPPIRRPRPGLPGKRPGGPRRQNVSRPLTARPTRFENPSEKQNEEITTQAPLLSRESVSELATEPENRPVQPPRRRFGSSTSAPRRNQFTTPRGRRKGFRKRVQNNRVSTPRRRKPTTLPRFTTEFEEVTTHVPTTTVTEFTTLPQEEDVTFSGFEQTTQDFFDTTLRSDLERTTFTPEEETTLQEFSTVTSRGRVRFENRHRPTQLPRITERPHHRSTLASKVAAFSNNEDATVQPVTRPLKPDTPEPPKPSSTFKPFEFETSATTISPTRFFTESPSAGGISTFTGFDFDLDTTPPTTFADFEESTQSSSGRFRNSQNFVHTTFSPFGDNQKQSINPKLHQTTSHSHTPRPSHNSDFDEAFFAEEDPPFVNRKETETFPPAFPVTTPSNPFFEEIQETETFPPVFPTTTPDDFFHKEIKQTETFPPAFPITTPENPFFGEIKDADAFPPSLTITPPSNSFFVNDQDTTTFSPDFATTVKPNFEFNRKQEAQTTQPPFQTTIPPNTVTPRIIVVALPILNQAPASPSNSNQSPPQSPVSERVVSPVNQESSSPFPDVIPPQTDRPLGHVQVTSEAGFIPREVHRPSTLTGGVRITAEEGFIPRDVSTRFFNQRNDTPSISPKFSVPTTISPPVKSLHPSPFLEGRPIIHDEFFNAPVSGFTPPTTLIPPENPSTRQSILLRPFESLTPPSAPFVPSTPSPGSPPPQNNFQQNRGSPLRPFLPPSPTTARPRTSTLAGILSTLINKNPTTTKQPTTKSPTTPPQPFTTQDPIIVSTDPPFSNQLGTGPPAPASIQPHFSNNDRITSSKPLKPFDGDRNHLSHQEPVIPTRAVEPNLPSRSDGQDSSRLPSPSSRPGPPSLESIPSQNAFDGRGDVRFSVRPSPDKDSPSEGSADAPPAPTPSHFPSSVSNSLPPFPSSSKPNPNPLIKFPSRPSGDRPVLISSNRPSGAILDNKSSSADPSLLHTTNKPRPGSLPGHMQDGDSAFFFLSMDGHVTTHSTPAFPNSQSSSSSTHNQPPFSNNNNQPFDNSQSQLSNNKNKPPFSNDQSPSGNRSPNNQLFANEDRQSHDPNTFSVFENQSSSSGESGNTQDVSSVPIVDESFTQNGDDTTPSDNIQPLIITTPEPVVPQKTQAATETSNESPVNSSESPDQNKQPFIAKTTESPISGSRKPSIISSTGSPATNPNQPFIITNTESSVPNEGQVIFSGNDSPVSHNNQPFIVTESPVTNSPFIITNTDSTVLGTNQPFIITNSESPIPGTNQPFITTSEAPFQDSGSLVTIDSASDRDPTTSRDDLFADIVSNSPFSFHNSDPHFQGKPFIETTFITEDGSFISSADNPFFPSNIEGFFFDTKTELPFTSTGSNLFSGTGSPSLIPNTENKSPLPDTNSQIPVVTTQSPISIADTSSQFLFPNSGQTSFSNPNSQPPNITSNGQVLLSNANSQAAFSPTPFFQSTTPSPATPLPTTPFSHSTSPATSRPFFQSTTPSPASPVPTTTPFSHSTSPTTPRPFFQSTTPSPASPVPTTSSQPLFSASSVPNRTPFFQSTTPSTAASVPSNTPFFQSTTPSQASPVPTTTPFSQTTPSSTSPVPTTPFFHSTSQGSPASPVSNTTPFFFTTTPFSASPVPTTTHFSSPSFSSTPFAATANHQPLFPISANSGSTLTSPSSQFSSFPTTPSSIPANATPQPAITTHRPAARFPLPTAASPQPVFPSAQPAITTHRPASRFPLPATASSQPVFPSAQPAITTHRPASNFPLPTTASPHPLFQTTQPAITTHRPATNAPLPTTRSPPRASRPSRTRGRPTTSSRPRSRSTQAPRSRPTANRHPQLSPNPRLLLPPLEPPSKGPPPSCEFAPTANRGSAKFTSTTPPSPPPTRPPPRQTPRVRPQPPPPPSPTRGPSLLVPFGTEDQSAAPGAAVERDPDNDHVPGLGGVDYPILEAIPKTSFKCTKEMRLSGRMFADPETACQVYHVCSGHQTFSFLCPRGTIFHQDTFVCQWWFTVDCQAQAQKLAQIQAQSGR
ncbi:hypothetical protein C7M84_024121 [Penaeus vannamei]|uniref:Chitin-binding type-2 domain-containing protein n=1 Tax=Penaeus vannamei TaxID=6689 RepID=A0A423U1X9_PENVA|nr:hypothetical protein C7M84_024121 [Penaeus vannamei]